MSEETKKKAAEATASEKAEKVVKAKPKKTKKARAQVPQGKMFIQATFNNTIVTATDMNGNVIGWASAGGAGFKGPKKATPYAASVVVRELSEKIHDVGLKDVHVFLTGVGQGREGALRALNANNLNVLSIKDVTPVPHNGCRPSRPRRV
ncbi:MAG: 30S ribosomal protein S11 [Patescibacteria group bacterium]